MDWKTINIAPEIVAKYLAKGKTPPSKPKQEWVTRYHRTRTSNAPSIEQHGLITYNPNIGENTWLPGEDDYHKIWLANNPSEIPVLRQLTASAPHDVTTYKVRMPKEWYMESPRFYMPRGRGAATMERAPANEIRWTDEDGYKIDLLGRDIPPEYLQKLPEYRASDWLTDNRSKLYLDLSDITNPKNIQKLPKRLRAEAGALNKDLANNDYLYLSGDRPPSDELITATVSPVLVARDVINRAKHDGMAHLSKQDYLDIDKTLGPWIKRDIKNKLAQARYGSPTLDYGLPAIPGLKDIVDRYLIDYVTNK